MNAKQHADIWNAEEERLLVEYNDAIAASALAVASVYGALLQHVQHVADAYANAAEDDALNTRLSALKPDAAP